MNSIEKNNKNKKCGAVTSNYNSTNCESNSAKHDFILKSFPIYHFEIVSFVCTPNWKYAVSKDTTTFLQISSKIRDQKTKPDCTSVYRWCYPALCDSKPNQKFWTFEPGPFMEHTRLIWFCLLITDSGEKWCWPWEEKQNNKMRSSYF